MCMCDAKYSCVHIRFPHLFGTLTARMTLLRVRTTKNWKCRRRRQSFPGEREKNHWRRQIIAAKYDGDNLPPVFLCASLLLLLPFLLLCFRLIVENVRRYKKVSRGTHSTHFRFSADSARGGLPVSHRNLSSFAFARTWCEEWTTRSKYRTCVEDIVRSVRPVSSFFHLLLSDFSERPTLHHRFRAFLPPAFGFQERVEKREREW